MLSGRGVSGRLAALAALVLTGGLAGRVAAEPGGPKALAEEIRRSAGVAAGLCVHLGCGGGALTAELGATERLVVHGLEPDAALAAKARSLIDSRGLTGRVSVEAADLKRLPYPENLVNLVVSDDLGRALKSGLELKDVLRVLCPGGAAFLGDAGGGLSEADLKAALTAAGIPNAEVINRGGLWVKFSKPRPAGMDDWPHAGHGADGNLASRDTLGAPAGVRWAAGPVWAPHLWSREGLTAGGRLFCITGDEAYLVARDAYNGVLLWKKDLTPARPRLWRPWPYLVAVDGDRLYAVLEDRLQAVDVQTGRTMATFDPEGSRRESVVYSDGVLVSVVRGGLRAWDARRNEPRWTHTAAAGDVVIGDGRVFFLDLAREPYDLVCLDLAGGKQVWRVSTGPLGPPPPAKWVVHGGRLMHLCFVEDGRLILLSAGGVRGEKDVATHGLSARDGKHLWTHRYDFLPMRVACRLRDVMSTGGLVWFHGGKRAEVLEAVDPATGQSKRRLEVAGEQIRASCQRDVATSRYVFTQKHFDFVDLETGRLSTLRAAGGACGLGGIVGNGLWYAFPFACACNFSALRGFLALGPAEAGQGDPGEPDAAGRLETGPAYSVNPQSAIGNPQSAWPTYRGNALRSGATPSPAPADLKPVWTAPIDSPDPARGDWKGQNYRRITSLTVAEGKVFLAVPETHRVLAMDASTGRPAWTFTAGGRVDMPPTVHKGLCLFGSRDGWVYALSAGDGRLVWRFRAAPRERKVVAYGQVESVWPVGGSVLVEEGVACFAAGRSNAADGGLFVCAVEPRSGRLLWQDRPRRGARPYNGLEDTLVGDGTCAYLGHWRFNLAGGEAPAGRGSSAPAYPVARNFSMADSSWCTVPHAFHSSQAVRYDNRGTGGQMLVVTPETTHAFTAQTPYTPKVPPELSARRFEGETDRKGRELWSVKLPGPMQVEAMVLAGNVLLAAGPADAKVRKEGFVTAFSATDGKQLNQWPLPAPPIYEGLAVAGGRVYVATEDGKVLCLGAESH